MCAFGKMLEHEAKLLDPSSREATLFRKRRCRIPYQVFKKGVDGGDGREEGAGSLCRRSFFSR